MEKLFELHEGDNIGGISKFEIAHVTDFLSFNPISFRQGKGFVEIPHVPSSGSLKDEEQTGKSGTSFSYSGALVVHAPTKAVEQLLRKFMGNASVCRITDLNGVVLVIGSPDCPVSVSRTGNRGRKPSDMAHNEIRFAVEQYFPAG